MKPGTLRNRLFELLAVISSIAPGADWSWLRSRTNLQSRRAKASSGTVRFLDATIVAATCEHALSASPCGSWRSMNSASLWDRIHCGTAFRRSSRASPSCGSSSRSFGTPFRGSWKRSPPLRARWPAASVVSGNRDEPGISSAGSYAVAVADLVSSRWARLYPLLERTSQRRLYQPPFRPAWCGGIICSGRPSAAVDGAGDRRGVRPGVACRAQSGPFGTRSTASGGGAQTRAGSSARSMRWSPRSRKA